jgi:hypothetical protein
MPLLAADYENRQGRKMQALGAQGDIIGAKGGITGAQAGIYEGGLARAGQFASLLPMLTELRYDPMVRLAQAGGARDERAQAVINDAMARHDVGQGLLRAPLERYNMLVKGMGTLGGTTTGSRSQPGKSPLTGALGGAVAGGSLFGPLGALGGGLLGFMA